MPKELDSKKFMIFEIHTQAGIAFATQKSIKKAFSSTIKRWLK